jgi:hypothetical protein
MTATQSILVRGYIVVYKQHTAPCEEVIMNDRELMEPVEVVGYLNTATDEVVKYGPTLMDWDDEQEPVEPLMTVAQHKRLMAAKDGDAVKVPRAIAERMAIDAAQYEHEHAVVNDNVQLWQQPRARLTLTVGDLRTVRALLGGDQPAHPLEDPLEWSRKHGIEEF